MEIIEAKEILICTGNDTYFSLRQNGSGIANKKVWACVSDGVDLYPIYEGMKTLVSDGVDLYFMGGAVCTLSGSDFVCQAVSGGNLRATDWVCEYLLKQSVLTS
jgi:hypothetical protein